MLGVRVAEVAVRSSNEFTLQIVDVAFAVEKVLLVVTFYLDALKTPPGKVLRVVDVNNVFVLVLSFLVVQLVGHCLILFLLFTKSIVGNLFLIEKVVRTLYVLISVTRK